MGHILSINGKHFAKREDKLSSRRLKTKKSSTFIIKVMIAITVFLCIMQSNNII